MEVPVAKLLMNLDINADAKGLDFTDTGANTVGSAIFKTFYQKIY